jgi:hypothetical protein
VNVRLHERWKSRDNLRAYDDVDGKLDIQRHEIFVTTYRTFECQFIKGKFWRVQRGKPINMRLLTLQMIFCKAVVVVIGIQPTRSSAAAFTQKEQTHPRHPLRE